MHGADMGSKTDQLWASSTETDPGRDLSKTASSAHADESRSSGHRTSSHQEQLQRKTSSLSTGQMQGSVITMRQSAAWERSGLRLQRTKLNST